MVLLKDQIVKQTVPAGKIALWWIGQIGFIFKSPRGKIIVVDPYLTNSCKEIIGDREGYDMDRMVPPPLSPADLAVVDLYAVTHGHMDHLDPETLKGYQAAGGKGPYLAPCETVAKLQRLGAAADQIEPTWPNKVSHLDDFRIRAAFAIPYAGDDLGHVGYLVSVEGGPTVYVTGDTGYHKIIADSVGEHKPDVLLAAINGTFNNLGPAEAALLGKQIDARVIIPCHYDIFPCNQVNPRLLQTNLQILGIGQRYKELKHGQCFLYPD